MEDGRRRDEHPGPHLADVREAISVIWRGSLPHIGDAVEPDFIRHGGNSLSAAITVIELKKRFGVDISMGELYFHSSLDDFSTIVWRTLRAEQR